MKASEATKKAQQARSSQARRQRAAEVKAEKQQQEREAAAFPAALAHAKRKIAEAVKHGYTSVTLNQSIKVAAALRKLGYRTAFYSETVDHGDMAAPCVCTEHYLDISWDK